VADAGFEYYSMGRPAVHPAAKVEHSGSGSV
jgi:hypothetical protein